MSGPMLAPSLLPLVAVFSDCFTAPSFGTFQHLLAGWILCLGRHTVTGVLKAAGAVGVKHVSSFHRFFSVAAWRAEGVGLRLLGLVMPLVPQGEPIVAALDDTLGRHTGKKIRGAGMHHDPLLSTRTKAVFHFGHVWVVLAIVIRIPAWDKSFALPVLARLYRPKKVCKREGRPFLKKTEMAAQLVSVLAQALPDRQLVVVADAAYANASVIKPLPTNVHFIGRSRLDAALYAKPRAKRMGRPRIKGQRLPSPAARARSSRGWSRLTLRIHGHNATIQVKVFDALWYVVGGGRLLRFVLVRGWPGHEQDDVLVSTDLALSAKEVIRRYCLRWSLEVTFKETKGKLGLEDPQNRTDQAVERTAPLALWTYSLTVVWYATIGRRLPGARVASFPWYTKTVPAFSDMLAALRREAWRTRLLDPARTVRWNQKSERALEPLLHAVGYGG